MTEKIAFNGIVQKVQTTIDGGWSVTFVVDSTEVAKMALLGNIRDEVLTVEIPLNKQQEDNFSFDDVDYSL